MVVADVDSGLAENVEEKIVSAGGRAVAILTDVSNKDSVYEMVDETVKRFGKLDIVVNNAGITNIGRTIDITEDDWDSVFAVNAKGVFLCSQAAAKQMVKQKRGKIINCASIAGRSGFGNFAHYSASKAAVIVFSQGLAKEMAPYGVTVNCYAPGIIDTEMWVVTDRELGKILGFKEGEAFRKYSADIPLRGKAGKPEDVAKVVLFLASEDSDYLTGQTINVDGGMLMY